MTSSYYFKYSFFLLIIRFTLRLKNTISHLSKEVSLSSSDFNIIITKPKEKSIQYRTERSISHLYSNITPVNENPFLLFALRISWTFIYPNENGIYGRIYLHPYPDITNATRATAHWVYESEFQISFFFLWKKKCLRGVWNEEKSIVV